MRIFFGVGCSGREGKAGSSDPAGSEDDPPVPGDP